MDTTETTEVTSERKPKGRIRRFLFRVALVLAVAGVGAHLAWKYSGSNEWERVGARNGITVYSLKTPGSSIEKFKAVWTVRSKLSRFVMWVNDTKSNAMRSNTGLHDLRILERQGDRVMWTAYKQPLVSFLKTREFVIKSELSQNPTTNVLVYTVTGFPDRIPPDDCCVRVPLMANRWTLTPLKNGDIEVEWYCDMDLGGAVPYVMQNKVMPQGMLNFAPKVQGFIEREKYKNAKYDWVQEAPAVGSLSLSTTRTTTTSRAVAESVGKPLQPR